MVLHATWHDYGVADLEALAAELEARPPAHAVPVPRTRAKANGTGDRAEVGEIGHEVPDDLQSEIKAALGMLHTESRLARAWRKEGEAPKSRHSGWMLKVARLAREVFSDWPADKLAAVLVLFNEHHDRPDKDGREIERAIEVVLADDPEAEPEQQPEPAPEPDPFPLDALPPIMRAAVTEYQAFGQQPVEMPLALLLPLQPWRKGWSTSRGMTC